MFSILNGAHFKIFPVRFIAEEREQFKFPLLILGALKIGYLRICHYIRKGSMPEALLLCSVFRHFKNIIVKLCIFFSSILYRKHTLQILRSNGNMRSRCSFQWESVGAVPYYGKVTS